MSIVSAPLKRVLRALVGEYGFFYVYSAPLPPPPSNLPAGMRMQVVDRNTLESSDDPGMRGRASYDGPDTVCFGLYVNDELVSIRWYWWGESYREKRNRWKLRSGEAKSLGVYTPDAFRGAGYASILNFASMDEMWHRGFTKVYCRIWHNHVASIRVHEKAGYRRVGMNLEVSPGGKLLCLRIPLPSFSSQKPD